MLDICNAVFECHMNKVVHKDLKPQNILSSNGKLKLCDFGISKILENTQMHINTTHLSKAYAAPEILRKLDFRFKVDIWSLGCVLYELCALKKPYHIQYQWAKYDAIPLQKYSSQLQILISELLQEKPEFRPSINIVFRMLNVTIQYIYIYIYLEKIKDIREIQGTISNFTLKIQKLEKEKQIDIQKILDLEKENNSFNEKIERILANELKIDNQPEEIKGENFITCQNCGGDAEVELKECSECLDLFCSNCFAAHIQVLIY